MFSLLPARLLLNAPQRASGNVTIRVLDSYQPRVIGMLELMVRTLDPS